MLNRLNYYSRYNRIKTPKEIQTLYHLVQDMNLDTIVTDDLIQRVSYLRDTHLDYREEIKRNARQEYQGDASVELDFKDIERSEESRRNKSYDKKSSDRGGNNLRQQIMQYLKLNTSREAPNNHPIYEQPENHTQRLQNQRKSNQGEQNKSSQQHRNKTNNLSEMNCLQTQSIPQSQKQVDDHPQSPINKLEEQSHEGYHESQFFQTNQKDIGYLKSSNFADQFSEGLAELHKVDDVRNSSYYNNNHQPNNGGRNKQFIDQECRSEKLYRLYGSDLEVDPDRQDDIIGDYDQPHPKENSDIFIDQDENRTSGIPKMVPVEMVFNETQSHLQEDPHDYEHEEGDENESVEEEFKKKEASIDQRLTKNIDHSEDLQSIGAKIPSKGFSEGKWPFAETQKSIQGIIDHELSPLPETLIQNSGLAQKQRKPFKKMMMDRKLNPRMVTSTFVNDIPAPPAKKVNFKKMIKKQSAENRAVKQLTPENKKPKQIKPAEEKKQLLKAFFDQN